MNRTRIWLGLVLVVTLLGVIFIGLGAERPLSAKDGEKGTPVYTVQVAAGDFHTVALKTDGTLFWAWGKNNKGQLGLGDTEKRYIPTKIGTAADTNWVEVFVGKSHTIARKSDNTLWGWGNNGHGQLGLGDKNNRTIPNKIGTDKTGQKLLLVSIIPLP